MQYKIYNILIPDTLNILFTENNEKQMQQYWHVATDPRVDFLPMIVPLILIETVKGRLTINSEAFLTLYRDGPPLTGRSLLPSRPPPAPPQLLPLCFLLLPVYRSIDCVPVVHEERDPNRQQTEHHNGHKIRWQVLDSLEVGRSYIYMKTGGDMVSSCVGPDCGD